MNNPALDLQTLTSREAQQKPPGGGGSSSSIISSSNVENSSLSIFC